MKKIFNLFLLLIPIFIYSQKIGIVSNISPNMGYVYLKGSFKAVPVIQQELDFNFYTFLEENVERNNYSYELKDDFNFSKLENIDLLYPNKKEAKYINEYCEKHGFDKLLILRKNTTYKGAVLWGINDVEYNFGIATQSLSKKRAFLYSNFLIIPFNKGDDDLKNAFGNFFITHKFDENVYDGEMKLKDDKTIIHFLPILKESIIQNIEKFLK